MDDVRTPNPAPQEKVALLGGGCFWCVEAIYRDLRGVTKVQSGYAGGHTSNPSYREVCTGSTGHAEVVQVTYDPAEVSYADLLRIFFVTHDPTTFNRQGNDIGTQYRSVIFTGDESERATAQAVRDEIAAEGIWANPIVTEIAGPAVFWPAEEEHDDYFARNPYSGYCQAVVAPKVVKFRKAFADRLKETARA
jgi:peptide-methionine (S)-S-oxide reductase